MVVSWYFQKKLVLRWLLKIVKFGEDRFPCKSLLLSTTVLNDKVYHHKFYTVYVYGKINIYIYQEFIIYRESI